MHKSNSLTTQLRRLWIRCAELDARIQDFVVKLLDRELSCDGGANHNGALRRKQDQ
jgi:hypothetical protein